MFLIFKSTYKTPSDRKPSLTLSILFSHPLRWSVCQTSHSWWAPACRWVNEGPTLQRDKCEVPKNRILSALQFPHQICPAAPSNYISNSKRPIATSRVLGIDLTLAWGNGRTNRVPEKLPQGGMSFLKELSATQNLKLGVCITSSLTWR